MKNQRAAIVILGSALALGACAGKGTDPKPKPPIIPKTAWKKPPNPLVSVLEGCERAVERSRIHRRRIDFSRWVKRVRRIAASCGVERKTLQAELSKVRRDRRVLRLMAGDGAPAVDEVASTGGELARRRYRRRSQSRFVHPVQRFVERDMAFFVRRGVEQYKTHEALLKKIADRHNVDLHYLMAIWGVETAYGTSAGNFDVIRSLATLGNGHRAERNRLFFTKELIAALILIDKEIAPKEWVGSYAGASGSPQFMPSDVIRFSASYDGKVHADIWDPEKPADALTSIAWFLREKARWNPEHDRTLIEVRLPKGFDFDKTNRFNDMRPALDYARMGLKDAENHPVIHRWLETTIYLPAGCSGPAFLVNANFKSLLVYNVSYPYALKVSLLAEALRQEISGKAFKLAGAWPRRGATLSRRQVRRLQKRLNRLGYRGRDRSRLKADGFMGSNTRVAIRKFQKRIRTCPDGIANRYVYSRLMRSGGQPKPRRRTPRNRRISTMTGIFYR